MRKEIFSKPSLDIHCALQEIFVDASEALYRATEYDNQISGKPEEGLTSGKHFAEIRVLVPRSWPKIEACDGSTSGMYATYK